MRTASTLSLLLVLVAGASAESFRDLSRRLQGASPARIVREVSASPEALGDTSIVQKLAQAREATGSRHERFARDLVAMVELKALGEGGGATRPSAIAVAKEIKRSPVYQDAGVDEESNWLGRALGRLRNLRLDFRPPDLPQSRGVFSFGPWLIRLVWVLLAIAGAILLFLALRHVKWKTTLARRAKAILEEDEPERTLDEWLVQADTLAAEGRYREAVRALYLACLLRFDEHRVARFLRGQTNWEHLARIQASERRPADLDFRPATQAFDRIWYGKRVRGMEDVEQFRAWYQELTAQLAGRSA